MVADIAEGVLEKRQINGFGAVPVQDCARGFVGLRVAYGDKGYAAVGED